MVSAPGMQARSSMLEADRPASESRVDSDSHFNGLFETKQNLRIEGIAEGEIQCEGTVTVAEGARVKAKVTANTVTIAGVLEGEVVCRDVFQIMPTGQVEATVSARRLIVQEGGFYNGEFHMITEASPTVMSSLGAREARAGGKQAARVAEKSAGPAAGGESSADDDWWAKLTNPSEAKSEGDGDTKA